MLLFPVLFLLFAAAWQQVKRLKVHETLGVDTTRSRSVECGNQWNLDNHEFLFRRLALDCNPFILFVWHVVAGFLYHHEQKALVPLLQTCTFRTTSATRCVLQPDVGLGRLEAAKLPFLCGLGDRPGGQSGVAGTAADLELPRTFVTTCPGRCVSLRRTTVTWKWTKWKAWWNTPGTCTSGFHKLRPILVPLCPHGGVRLRHGVKSSRAKPEGWRVEQALATLRGGFHQ